MFKNKDDKDPEHVINMPFEYLHYELKKMRSQNHCGVNEQHPAFGFRKINKISIPGDIEVNHINNVTLGFVFPGVHDIEEEKGNINSLLEPAL